MNSFLAADGAQLVFELVEHNARGSRGCFLYFILAFATAAPARFYEVSALYTRKYALDIACFDDFVIPSYSRAFEHVFLYGFEQ